MENIMINKDVLVVLREERKDLFDGVYRAARELKSDLRILFGSHSECRNPEDRYLAVFSIDDDLHDFMTAMKLANCYLKENHGCYLTPYNENLKRKRGQYTLATGIIAVMDEVSFAERRKTGTC